MSAAETTSEDTPIPAHHFEFEAAVLGGVLLEGRAGFRQLTLMPADFYIEGHREIFAAMQTLARRGDPIDSLTVAGELRRTGVWERAGGDAKIALLLEHASILVNLPGYAAQVAEDSWRRRYHELGKCLIAGSVNGATSADLAARAAELLAEHRAQAARPRPGEAPSELTALLAHRFPPRADIIGRGLLPRGALLLIGGAPKVGKSLLLDNLCLQRARGRPWLGFPTDSGVTLVVQSELRARAVAERFRTMLRNDPEPVPEGRLHIKTRRGVMLDEPAGRAQIEAWLEETGADLLRIDPLARHMTGDENSNRDMGAVVRAIDALIEQYGVTVVVAHHPSKPKDGEPRQGGMRLRGASALFGAADSILMLDKADDGFTLTFELRHDAAPEPMRLVRTEHLWLIQAGPDPALLALAALTAQTPLPYTTLAAAAVNNLKLSVATAKRRIAASVAACLLEKDLDGLYRPAAGYHCAGSQSHEVSADA